MRIRNKSLYTVLTLFVIFIILIVITTYFSNRYIQLYTNTIQEHLEDRLLSECNFIASIVPREILEEFVVPEDMQKPIYKQKIEELEDYVEKNNLMFAFFVRLTPDGQVQYIIDSDPDPETHYGLEHFEEPYDLVIKAFEGQPAFSKIGEYLEDWEGILSAYVPVFDDEGNVIAAVGIDISDEEIVARKNIEKYFRYAYMVEVIVIILISSGVILTYRNIARKYNHASIAKSQFLSRMSHEIRTPMNAIMGFSRMAKNTKDMKEKDEYIGSIDNASGYLLQIINNILDISKIEAGRMVLDAEKISIPRVMNNIYDMLNSQAESKNQKFIMGIGKNIPEIVYGDKIRITQILMLLVSNAIKFTPKDGEISLTGAVLDRKDNLCSLQFIIKDNGIGIEEQYLDKIFEPFELADAGLTREYGGTGLGLAISKMLIELMKGHISVTSKIGVGTTFTFNIWLEVAPEGEELEEEEEIQTTVDCKGKTFLVIEDNEVNQVLVENILKDFGADVEFANNGKEGLEKFLSNSDKYDIIFMDIQMPIMDGFNTTKEIRRSNVKNAKTIPIIAMTGEVYKEDIDHAIEAGMNAHVGKPFKIEEIVSAINKIMR